MSNYKYFPAFKDAVGIFAWYRAQLAHYSIDQCKQIEAEALSDETRAVFGMLWRAKNWLKDFEESGKRGV